MKLENELNMTTNPSIWRIEGNELVEQPTMKQPEFKGDYFLHYGPQKQYDSHIASRRRYPHNLPDHLKGKYLREGEHFRLQHQWMTGFVNSVNREKWEYLDIDEEEYNELGHASRRIIALPISQPEQPISEVGAYLIDEKTFPLNYSGVEQPISEEGKEFKQLLKRYVTDFALMLQAGENIRSMYEHYEKGNRLSIEKLMLLATPSQEAIDDEEIYKISDIEKVRELYLEAKKSSSQWCKKAMESAGDLKVLRSEFEYWKKRAELAEKVYIERLKSADSEAHDKAFDEWHKVAGEIRQPT